MRCVIETSSCEMISALSIQSVWRRMPRERSFLTPGEEAGALFLREPAPEVSHARSETAQSPCYKHSSIGPQCNLFGGILLWLLTDGPVKLCQTEIGLRSDRAADQRSQLVDASKQTLRHEQPPAEVIEMRSIDSLEFLDGHDPFEEA